MKLWTLVIDSKGGTSTEVFTDEAKLDARAFGIVADEWSQISDGEMPDDWRAAYEHLHRGSCDLFLTATDHDIEAPPVAIGGIPAFPGKVPHVVREYVGSRMTPEGEQPIYRDVVKLVDMPGLSKREWFAGQAMAGLLANHDHEGVGTWLPVGAANFAVKAADALIEALKSTDPHPKT